MPKRPTKDPKFIELTQDIDLNAFARSIKGAFPDAEDPRHLTKTIYPFWFLMLLILCGYLGGANTILDLAVYAEFNMDWINEMIGQRYPFRHTAHFGGF